MVTRWDTVEVCRRENFKIFDLSLIRRKHPGWGKVSEFVVLDSADWVNIIPVTKQNNVILIEQFRHGINDVTIEIPGGLIESGEEPRFAGERECIEETGYAGSGDAVLLGVTTPNPAFLNNKCYSYLWLDCERKFEQNLDANEDIHVIEVPLKDIYEYIKSGKIRHSLVLNAFFFYFLNRS